MNNSVKKCVLSCYDSNSMISPLIKDNLYSLYVMAMTKYTFLFPDLLHPVMTENENDSGRRIILIIQVVGI